MKLLGISLVIVTNAAGGLNPSFNIGDFMIISDHVSVAGMGGVNPLIGPNMNELGPRFPPVSDAYDFDARVVAAKTALELGLETSLREGVYSFVGRGIALISRFLRDACKADCVGMSTVPEVVAAKHCGLKVLGLSLITNKVSVGRGRSAIEAARGDNTLIAGDELAVASHSEVLETSKARSLIFVEWVKKLIPQLTV
ncbi:hypothetical protein HDU91_002866 [Kappamyces sp. JEL0680]|nr:hypothetical protein HDU91_002866 [Kappamyces sp. JEL0680]